LLQVDVNRQRLDEPVLVLRREDGTLLIAGEDLDRWRLRRPSTPPYEHEGRLFYPSSDLPSLKLSLDERTQTLTISADPQAFAGTVQAVTGQRYPPPVLPQPGGFFNYTLSGTRIQDTTTRNGLFEAGFFSQHGVFTSSVVAPELTRSQGWLRLDSTYAVDYPAELVSVRLGDTITRPGTWGRAVRIGGAQYGTNFSTQPGFIRSPVLQAAGSAVLPSTVDVFMNNALVQRSAVPPGPFSIQNIPVVTGSGEVRMVVRDLLGREQVITQPFYSSATLLKQGLADYSCEVGAIRNNFAVESNDYGQAVGAATYRRGITDYFTGEVRGEATRDLQAVGFSSAVRAGNFGVLSGTFAGSRSEAGVGRLLGLGVEHLSGSISVALQTQVTSPDFRQTGMEPNELPRRRQTFGTIGYAMGPLGSLSATYGIQQFRDQPQAEIATLTYSVPLGKVGNLSLTALRSYGAAGATTVFATVTIPLGELTSGTVTFDRTRDSATGATSENRTLVMQKGLPLGDGYGYRVQRRNEDLLGSYSLQTGVGTYVLAIPLGELTSGTVTFDRTRDSATGATSENRTLVMQKGLPLGDGYGYRVQRRNEDLLGSYSLQTGVGTYVLEASRPKEGPGAARVGITGGIGVVGGHPFFSRALTDSFGVVRVADYSNVRVLQDNQVVAQTDGQGYAVLPRLRSYDRNQVSIDHNDLPFDAILDRLRLDAVPYLRSGVLLEFPVHRVRAATLHVLLEDGTPLPSGALARFEGKDKQFPVALRGEAYLERPDYSAGLSGAGGRSQRIGHLLRG
ncbi:MAG: fimbrial biogenesis outer membrane usher protein, partial [Betaproteobacteria bacterium]